MPETVNAAFRDEKNKLENTPIMLYALTLNDASLLRLAEWDVTIEYPTGSGYNYLPFPVTHEGLGLNALGEIDAVKVRLSNINREIGAVIIANNGFKGNKVSMTTVFRNLLGDSNAHTTADYWVDSWDVTETEALFLLTSKLDLYEVQCPNRIMERDHCPWTFKKEGCWIWNGSAYVARANFSAAEVECDHTRKASVGCRFHHPTGALPFGGFPGIPNRGIYVF